jgi:hypothetical protein
MQQRTAEHSVCVLHCSHVSSTAHTWYSESLKAAIMTRSTSIRFLSYSEELTTDFSLDPMPVGAGQERTRQDRIVEGRAGEDETGKEKVRQSRGRVVKGRVRQDMVAQCRQESRGRVLCA